MISATMRHIKDVADTSQLDRSIGRKYLTDFGLRDRILPSDASEKAIFPVEHLPLFRADIFIGRQDDMQRIHDWLSAPEQGQIRKYHIYGRRGIGLFLLSRACPTVDNRHQARHRLHFNTPAISRVTMMPLSGYHARQERHCGRVSQILP